MKKVIPMIALIIFGIIIFLFFLFYDIINGKEWSLYTLEIIGIMVGMILFISGSLFLVIHLNEIRIKKIQGIKILYLYLIVIIFLTGSISGLGGYLVKYFQDTDEDLEYKIGVYLMEKDDLFNIKEYGENPAITRESVDDIEAGFVADPFLVKYNQEYLIFYEVWNLDTQQGDISYSSSKDGKTWNYEGKVFDFDTHLAYPLVFEWNGTFYIMLDEGENRVSLFEAVDFPTKWERASVILEGDTFADSTIFHYNGTWYIFTSVTGATNLRLFYSDDLLGPYNEHPMSPILEEEPDYSRPGGRVQYLDGELIRIAQDNYPNYGMQLWGFRILELSKTTYEEELIDEKPILQGYENWNWGGVHQMDLVEFDDDNYLVCIDGKS